MLSEPVLPPPSNEIARHLRSVVLLAGQVGRSPFADGLGRSVLDLPVGADRAVLDVWTQELDRFARGLDLPRLHVCLSINQAGTAPRMRPRAPGSRIDVEVMADRGEYRGTAGVVKDLTQGYGPDDWVLVAAANQIQREPVLDVFRALCELGESVSLVPGGGSELAGMFLLRCARLREVPEVGFVDLKEQAIPAARGLAPLRVARRLAGSTLPVRTLAEYVHALRLIHSEASQASGEQPDDDPYAENWMPVFAIQEPGSEVAPGAVLQDSVVLAGGRVEAGAAVARSVICAGGVVRRGQCIVESVVIG